MALSSKKYATGGTVDVTITPAGGSFGAGTPPPITPPPPIIAANSTVAPLSSPPPSGGLPPASPATPINPAPAPFANAVANVPVGGTSGPMNSPYATPIGPTGMPSGSPPASPTSIPNPIAPFLQRGGTADAKRQGMAGGGIPTSEALDPWYTRAEYRGMLQPQGLVKSIGAGRTDVHPINVPAGSYVLPADVVSGLGEGNTLAGSSVVDRMMHSMPYGITPPRGGGHGMGIPHAPAAYKQQQALPSSVTGVSLEAKRGGQINKPHSDMVPIIVAGGEHILYPDTIAKKFGSLDKGHKILDKFVLATRKKTVGEMQKLKGPKGGSK